MKALARDMIVADDPSHWPHIGDMDAAVVRLEICRHLLTPLSEQAGSSDQAEPAPAALMAFEEIGAFLSAWSEERVYADAGRFCVETVRMLATLLRHLERGGYLDAAAPIMIDIG